MKHTPTPWEFNESSREIYYRDRNEYHPVVECFCKVDAEFIVRAVNNIERLEKIEKLYVDFVDKQISKAESYDELLEAAKHVEENLLKIFEEPLYDDQKELVWSFVEKLREAIQKAEGK